MTIQNFKYFGPLSFKTLLFKKITEVFSLNDTLLKV